MAGVVAGGGGWRVVAGEWWCGWRGGLLWLVWWVFGMACRYRTEPKLRNTGNTYTAKHRIRIGIDRTARLEPCERVLWKCQEKEAIWAR